MAQIYSNNYNKIAADGTGYDSRDTGGGFFSPSNLHGSRYWKYSKFTYPSAHTPLNQDKILYMTLKSSDVLIGVSFSCDDRQTGTSTWDIGVYKYSSGGGTFFHEAFCTNGHQMFENDMDQFAALNEPQIMFNNSLTEQDQGLPLWELANVLEPGKYDKDPMIDVVVAGICTSSPGPTANIHQQMLRVLLIGGRN